MKNCTKVWKQGMVEQVVQDSKAKRQTKQGFESRESNQK